MQVDEAGGSARLERLGGLVVDVAGVGIEALALDVPSGWRRRTSVVWLVGPDGKRCAGEDVTYAGADHDGLQAGRVQLGCLRGRQRLEDLWQQLDELGEGALFDAAPAEPKALRYRRWALESAALDLALAQADTSLAELLERPARALRFGVSLSLDGRHFERLLELRERQPDVRFKLDWSEGWDADSLARLAELGGVDVVDFKGHYRGDFAGPAADAEAYRAVAEALPGAWLEDPWLGQPLAAGAGWDGPAWAALEPFAERITWDAPFTSAAWLAALPVEPRAVNIKPSRLGSVAELMRVIELCEARGIGMYAGGQFELGPGRRGVQALASSFFSTGTNDCAPVEFNAAELPARLPTSPLDPAAIAGPGAFGIG